MKKRFLFGMGTVLLLSLSFFLLASCGKSNELSGAKNWPIEDFTFTNQDGEPFGLENLKGKVWVADFIFTNCDDVCLPMTYNMVRLQEMVKEEGIENVEFVSFSVDPEIDTPEVMKEFGETFNADFSNFHFLTGYTQSSIEEFAASNFKTIVKKPENEDQVIHQVYFYLINQDGKIQKFYPGTNEIPFAEIIDDIKKIQ